MRKPSVIALVLCDAMTVNAKSAKTSLTGLFQSRSYPSFPCQADAFTVYAALFGGVGEGTIDLAIFRLETEEYIYTQKRWHILPGPGAVLNLEIKVKKCLFPAAGPYSLSLRFDGRELTQRPLEIFRKK